MARIIRRAPMWSALSSATVMEPLRQEWAQVQATAERVKNEALTLKTWATEEPRQSGMKMPPIRPGRSIDKLVRYQGARSRLRYRELPLRLAGALMKRLEGEVLKPSLDSLAARKAFAWLDKQTVDPHQFLGLGAEPARRRHCGTRDLARLSAMAFPHQGQARHPSRSCAIFENINDHECRPDLGRLAGAQGRDAGRQACSKLIPTRARPDWPKADYIVGNPPFIGGKDIRAALGDDETKALWRVHPHINDSADFVMYWWDRAAEIVARGKAQRFGFVTTNSITQVFSRRVVARHLEAKKPVSLLMAIPDHPWTKATENAAAVRIAMTVAAAGRHEGVLREVVREAKLDTDQPEDRAFREGGPDQRGFNRRC